MLLMEDTVFQMSPHSTDSKETSPMPSLKMSWPFDDIEQQFRYDCNQKNVSKNKLIWNLLIFFKSAIVYVSQFV